MYMDCESRRRGVRCEADIDAMMWSRRQVPGQAANVLVDLHLNGRAGQGHVLEHGLDGLLAGPATSASNRVYSWESR
jgi:hypothetical protein